MAKYNNLLQKGKIFAPGRILELHKLDNKDIYKITILTEIPSRTKTSREKVIQVVEHYTVPANEIEQQIISNWRNIKLTTHLKYTLSQNGFDFELIGIKFNKIGIPNKKAFVSRLAKETQDSVKVLKDTVGAFKID